MSQSGSAVGSSGWLRRLADAGDEAADGMGDLRASVRTADSAEIASRGGEETGIVDANAASDADEVA